MCSRCLGSMPLNGSSSSRISGLCTSAAATLIRCRMPLEYVEILRSCAGDISVRPIAHWAARSGLESLCSFAVAVTNCSPVRNA